MNSGVDHPKAPTVGLPFRRPIVRRLAEELFREKIQWKSGDLVEQIVQRHRERGGVIETQPSLTVRRVLKDFKDEGLVDMVAHGWWVWKSDTRNPIQTDETEQDYTSIAIDDTIDEFQPKVLIEKEIGIGSECIYLYFNPNDRRLAEFEGRDVWECKVGRTSSCDAISRVLGQGVKTSLSHLPIVGLVLRTDDSAGLEKALHSSFRLVGAEVPDSPGNEWFNTSPVRVETWYALFQECLVAIRPESSAVS